MKSEKFASLNRRTIISILIIISAVLLGFRLFQMQILNRNSYENKSAGNSIKSIEKIPLRGVMYDRNMNLLVNNIPAYTIRITPDRYNKKLNHLLEAVLEVDSGYIDNILKQYKVYSRFQPIKIKRGVSFDTIAWLEENQEYLPGVDYIVEMHRDYPAGINGSHIFGYIKEVSQRQLNKKNNYYNLGDYIGSKGIEKTYETELRGKKGWNYVLVDSRRKRIGKYRNGLQDLPAVKGSDIVLSIDEDVQRVAEEELKGRTGALVAIEPATGEILALVSAPEYDLSKFSYITPKDFLQKLYNDPRKPLFNRATMSVKPPGSTYKILAAIAALDLGVINTSTTFYCNGGLTIGGRFFKCHGIHGNINVINAIEKSCNSFFYNLIFKIGIDRWADYSRRFGFGLKTGIDIGEENAGLIPDSKYYEKIYGPKWPTSIMASLVIGQGETSVTPLQLAQFTALIANNGVTYLPHLVKGFIDNTGNVVPYNFKKVDVKIDKKVFDEVKEGMFLVVNGEGTATHIRSKEYLIAGKTGTAQNPHGKDYAWFIAFAPYDNPQIAVAVLVENVGFGGTYAAPIAKKIIETYLNGLKENSKVLDNSIVRLDN